MTKKQRPLVVIVDPAGGEEPSRITRRLTDALARSGVSPERVAIDRLDLWTMPAEEIRAVLERLLDPDSTTQDGDQR